MFDIYYNDSIIRTGQPAPSTLKSFSQEEVDASGSLFHLNTRVEKTSDKYIVRAFDLVYNGRKYSLKRDVSFSHPSDNFSGWLMAKEDGTASLIVLDGAIMDAANKDPVAVAAAQQLYGQYILQLFTTIRGCCYTGSTSEAEELCLDMNRLLLEGELPADRADLPPADPVEAVQVNSPVFRDVAASMSRVPTDPVSVIARTKWDDLSSDQQRLAMKMVAERLGIVET